ncbi:MAG: coenzyme F420-0:L-glutamate ligase [Nitrosopumilus sp.]|nr:coenzyme F420-0:L-glutamate ligase [Nitrosopumilus sp.]
MQIIPLYVAEEIELNDDLAGLIINSEKIFDNDVLVIAQKIISKQEGRTVELSSIVPSILAEGIGSEYKKDSRVIELILNESKRIIRMDHGIIIVETNNGFICANAGIDESNVKHGFVTLLPLNSNVSAKNICNEILKRINKTVSVIISDTFGRPFRMGQTNYAIGISGMNPILDYVGTRDTFEKTLHVTAIAIADELCSAAELVMKKTANCPIAIIRGYDFKNENSSIDNLIRPQDEDLFR